MEKSGAKTNKRTPIMKEYLKITGSILLLSLVLISDISNAQEIDSASYYLDKYLLIAVENNPKLKSLQSEYNAALEEIAQESSLPDPQLNMGYFIQSLETRLGPQRATVSINQQFPWFGTLGARGKVATEKARLAKHMAMIGNMEVFRDIRITYDKLYYLHKAIEITEENLKLIESLKSLAQVHFENGKSGFTSVLQIEMEEEELQSKLEYLQDSQLPLQAKFSELIDKDLDEPIEFPEVLWDEELVLNKDKILDSINANSPHLVHYEHETKIHEYEVEIAKKEGLPSISLGMSYTNISPRTDLDPNVNLPDNGKDAFLFPQVGIRLPIFRKKYHAMREEAVLKQQAAEFEKKNLANEITTNLEQIYRDYLDAERKIKLYARLSTIARQSLDLLQTELSNNQKENSFFEIVRMERQLLEYELKLAEARTERNNNVYRINFLMGRK